MSGMSLPQALLRNFLGNSPDWYKRLIVVFLLINPVVLWLGGATLAGWLLLLQFIFTLAMALKCYPLQPGGLLALQAVIIGLTSAESVYSETVVALPVLLLLVFMVAGIFFLKELLLFTLTRILLGIRSHLALSLTMCFAAALLSAFLDALTVVAVLITAAGGFYQVFHRFASGKQEDAEHDVGGDDLVPELHRSDLDGFRAFLRGLMMHAAVGTALGGVTTQVGEPQNLLIAKQAGWEFGEFFLRMAPVSMPVLLAGLITCVLVDRWRLFGYGTPLPAAVREVLVEYEQRQHRERTPRDRALLLVQALAAVLLIVALGMHLAEVGLIGLLIIIVASAFGGITEEQRIAKAFETAMPFASLLVVFFAIVAVLHDQHLFEPVIDAVLRMQGQGQVLMLYLANGVLSALSDNVFVATIYISEVKAALLEGAISREQFDAMAIAVNTGTNIPSVATPNGQAAFLFLLTSALAPLIRLSYARMIWMALPYTIVMSLTGLAAVAWLI
jgi:NhaB family Na+:H+ antiporter